jgi:AraC-like DNA-binding protein
MDWTSMRICLMLESPVLRPYLPMTGPYQARVAGTPEQMLELLRAAPPWWVVLLAPGEGCPPALVRELVARAGMVPVLAAVELGGGRGEMLAELWEAGISDVVDLRPPPTPDALADELRAVHARPFKARLEAGLSPRVSMHGLTLLRAAAEVVAGGGNAAGLAARVGARERTLLAWCTREHLPAPKRLLVWLRMALAAALLEQPGRSISSAARGAGYAGDHSLRRVLHNELGAAFASAPRSVTFVHVLERFNAELRDLREAAREGRQGRAAVQV